MRTTTWRALGHEPARPGPPARGGGARRAGRLASVPARRHRARARLARGKTKLQALVATMRKLLHAIFGMFKHDQLFDGSKTYALAPLTAPLPQEVA